MECETGFSSRVRRISGSVFSRRDLLRGLVVGLGSKAWRGAVPARAEVGGIKIGVCRPSRDLEKAVQYGFDYLEPAAAEIAEMSAEAFAAFRSRLRASPVRCESYNSFVRNLRVVGDDVHQDQIKAYLDSTLERCRQLGGRIVVWGSAGSRNVPEGFGRDRAWEQIKQFLRLAGDAAGSRGLVIAIEPLRKQESNIINTGAEALRLVQEVNHPQVKMIIDYYHLRVENEDPEIVWTARKEIVHFHFANPSGRVWPRSASEDPEYGRFFEMVKRINYHGRISIEARGTFEQDARASLEFFHREIA